MKRLTLLLMMLFIVGCGDDDDKNPAGSARPINYACMYSNPDCDITPLAVGNSWIYDVFTYDSLGHQIGHIVYDHEVDKDSTVGPETWYRMDSEWYTNRSDGFWQVGQIERLLYKYPADVGDIYAKSASPDSTVVTSIDINLVTAPGLFNCYEYTREGTQMVSRLYFAPGIGPVQLELLTKKGDETLVLSEKWELRGYTVQ